MGFFKEFADFMDEQRIIGVALAFVIGIATATLVQALVKDIITPAYSPYLSWLNTDASVTVGLSKFMVGDLVSNIITWVVILLVVFLISKIMTKKKKAE